MADDLGSAPGDAAAALARVQPSAEAATAGPFGRYVQNSIDALMRIPGDVGRLAGRAYDAPLSTFESVASSFPQTRMAAEGPALAAALAGPLRVYHGSPNLFQRFARDRIGATEGTNYGVGHYFAENPTVAGMSRPPGGHLYDVRLNLDPDAVLNLNAPHAGQPNLIRAIGSMLNLGPGRYAPSYLADTGRAWLPTLRNTRFAGNPQADAMVADMLREHGAETVSVVSLDYVFDRENPLFARLEAFLRQ